MARFIRQWARLNLVMLVLACVPFVCPCRAQEPAASFAVTDPHGLLLSLPNFQTSRSSFGLQVYLAPSFLHGTSYTRPLQLSPLVRNLSWENSEGMIGRMESAFYCNDTPFIDQVRLPLAALWGGRIKLIGFESDVTTANFVLGLPGGGTLHSLGMYSSGHLAMRTPPSDQLVGMNMVFALRGRESGAADNRALHGFQYVMRASRGFLQSVGAR